MPVTRIDTHLHGLDAQAVFRVQELYGEWVVTEVLCPAVLQNAVDFFDVEGGHAWHSVFVNCKDGHRAFLLFRAWR